jgi:ABC-type transport system substrate-binding protein
MIKWLVLIGGIIFMTSSISVAAPKKYGYVPPTFPRDPAEVNQFAEHIVLGQILEPMVDTDKMGNVTPGLAESWTFEDKGLTIKFKIRKDRVFSNGKKLEAKDIKYTIDRVIQKKSQSSNFLGSISSIEVLCFRRPHHPP